MSKILSVLSLLLLVFIMTACDSERGGKVEPYIPWKTVDLDNKPGLFTRNKLAGLNKNNARCVAALREANVKFTPIPDKPGGECPLTNQITLDQSLYPYSQNVSGKCGLIAALIVWEQNAVKKNAFRIFGQDVAKITHYGMYSCRYINGNRNKPSEHAKGNAIDVAGFTLKDGTYISVKNDWNDRGRKGEFLRAVFRDSCNTFIGNLGPEYNAAHADHFHFDMGNWAMCD